MLASEGMSPWWPLPRLLSWHHVLSVTYLKPGHIMVSDLSQLLWPHWLIGYQISNPNNGHQGDMPLQILLSWIDNYFDLSVMYDANYV